jgi:hypothetical protein
MFARAAVLCAACTALGCAPPRAPVPARAALIPCAEKPAAPALGESAVLGRRIALVGDTAVVAGEISGPVRLDGQLRRCPVSPSVLILGVGQPPRGAAAGAPPIRFAWCVASAAPFPALAATADGFVVAGRIARDARVEPLVEGPGSPAPAAGPEDLAVLRFAADGTPRGRDLLARGPGAVAAVAALADGSLFVEGSFTRLPPAPLGAEHFFVRVDPQGAVTDLEPRTTSSQLGAAPVALVPRPAGGVFRAALDGSFLVAETIDAAGLRVPRASIGTGGIVVDLAAAAGADDALWLVWSARLGRGEGARSRRVLARADPSRVVNERELGREELDARVHAVVPLAADRAAVLWQVAKKAREEARFGLLELPEKRAVSAAVLVAYEIPGNGETALALLDDDAAGLAAAGRSDVVGDAEVAVTGWFRGALKSWWAGPLGEAPCGGFVERVQIKAEP